MGLGRFKNGDLIAAAEEQDFEALITADKNMDYQQNITGREIGIIVLASRGITLPSIKPKD